MKRSYTIRNIIIYMILILLAILLLYPLVWMLFASFKDNHEIFTGTHILPEKWYFDGYDVGWNKIGGKYTFTTFYLNSIRIVAPMCLFSVVSSALVAYGFARFKFPGRRILFYIMISTMLLPDAVLLIPRYLLFRDLGWINTYKPFIVPTIFASNTFFNYMLIQFFRGIPRELDESAKIDGCGPVRIFLYIMIPLSKSSLISVAVFQLIWAWNDFFNPLIYINTVSKYTVALGLRLGIDVTAQMDWRAILAMAVLSVIPGTVIYSFAQKSFTEGIVATGIKG